VKFKKPDPVPIDPEGIKWYIVVIICASVLVAVGVAYGMFIYMKKKRSEKNISLLTEKEEEGAD
jgi:predicted RND superfamily exporter protein